MALAVGDMAKQPKGIQMPLCCYNIFTFCRKNVQTERKNMQTERYSI